MPQIRTSETLPQWKWEDLQTLLEEASKTAPHQAAVLHMMQATRISASALPPIDLLREILALGALAHSRTSSRSPGFHPAASCLGSA